MKDGEEQVLQAVTSGERNVMIGKGREFWKWDGVYNGVGEKCQMASED